MIFWIFQCIFIFLLYFILLRSVVVEPFSYRKEEDLKGKYVFSLKVWHVLLFAIPVFGLISFIIWVSALLVEAEDKGNLCIKYDRNLILRILRYKIDKNDAEDD